jgi:hypothetical protein
LVYLSLLVGGGILLGDLVAVILTYLNGEITLRFILKALTLLVVIGAAFYYYIQDARGYWNSHEKHSQMYALGGGALVIVVLVLGFLNSDTPKEVREMRLDQQQVDMLNEIQWRIDDHFQVNKALPENIEVLYVGIEAPSAPEGREAYVYTTIDEDTYELCATFAYPSQRSGTDVAYPARSEAEAIKNRANNWDHGVGETCFERTVIDYSKQQSI